MYKVVISSDAFRQIFSSALEAYSVPQGRHQNQAAHIPLETYGSLWGYSNQSYDDTIFHVITSDTETSAHRRPDWVRRKIGAQLIKSGFNRQFHPELGYLGDFHSHPYSQGEFDLNTAQDVEVRRYFRFSGNPGEVEGDFANVQQLKSQRLPYRVGIVATIYRMKNCVEGRSATYLNEYSDKYSVIKFTYTGSDSDGKRASFRCWLKAYVFMGDDDTPVPDDELYIHCGVLGLIPWV